MFTTYANKVLCSVVLRDPGTPWHPSGYGPATIRLSFDLASIRRPFDCLYQSSSRSQRRIPPAAVAL